MSGEDYEISAIISNQEPPKEFSWASEVAEEAKTGIIIKKMKQKPKQAFTSSEVLAHMDQSGTSQAGNVPVTKTPATTKEKRKIADEKYRIKQKAMKEALERDVEQLKREYEKLRRENEDLTRSYDLVKECLQRVNSETEKSSIQLC
ncbi:hypothetical protein CFOL_v3_24427 [Cephalotus follicularis]|uniref:BZIP domain-containing protein n=1 Tax=Cephalotus follicularis TaxID=3775 RepID=A0A1Q3CLM2_CEPFO|nr:hypothetical protein CFOL_v3_24427 [Cephalotus follicularis]